MATEKQINANRKNAQKSTGPKTAEGKAAVSQNAVKHGIFTDSIIFGENLADYEAFHNEMLAELDPVGAVETTMAKRIVSLWWRLKRAERMQNETIEDMIIRKVTNSTSRDCREYTLSDQGLKPDDPGYDLDGLALGRIATKDFACCRVLDRMLMYERRIESSLIRLTKELRKQQLMRRVEQKFEPSPSLRDEAATREKEKISDLKKQSQSPACGRKSEILSSKSETMVFEKAGLKKQSQFVPGLMGVMPFMKGAYDDYSPIGEDENKANNDIERSQFEATAKPEGIGKRA